MKAGGWHSFSWSASGGGGSDKQAKIKIKQGNGAKRKVHENATKTNMGVGGRKEGRKVSAKVHKTDRYGCQPARGTCMIHAHAQCTHTPAHRRVRTISLVSNSSAVSRLVGVFSNSASRLRSVRSPTRTTFNTSWRDRLCPCMRAAMSKHAPQMPAGLRAPVHPQRHTHARQQCNAQHTSHSGSTHHTTAARERCCCMVPGHLPPHLLPV